jgi:hypothetical protein
MRGGTPGLRMLVGPREDLNCAATGPKRLRRPPRFAIDAPRPRAKTQPWRPLGDSSTVELRTLTPSILVRIQVPQPTISID